MELSQVLIGALTYAFHHWYGLAPKVCALMEYGIASGLVYPQHELGA